MVNRIGPQFILAACISFFGVACSGASESSDLYDSKQGTWKTESLSVNALVRKISIKVDSTGVVHALYEVIDNWTMQDPSDKSNYHLEYARRDSSGWSKQTLAAGNNFGTLTLGPDGAPHVAYIWQGGLGGNALKYAHPIDGKWVYED